MSWRGRKEPVPTSDTIENVVGRSCAVRGDLRADGAFRVDGTIEGSVESKASVVVGESGTVTGNIKAVDVLVAGKVKGNVHSTGHLEIMGTGVIEGDIEVKSLRVDMGGVFAGTSRMGGKSGKSEKKEEKKEVDVSGLSPQLSAVR
jgi:cytoskeletal protein CcmA (bactofilin family)